MTWDKHFKYAPMSPDKVKLIMEAYKNEQVYDYIMELYELIHYQKEMINQQRIEIISLKHKEAWKRYNLPESRFEADPNKPPKSVNTSC